MKQLLSAVAIAALALIPTSASAAPTPSPALSSLLVAAPAGYTPLTTATLHGRFDASAYASQYTSGRVEALLNLVKDGFVDGYGATYLQKSTNRVLLEFVIAFKGGKGAKSWLDFEEAADKGNADYKHADTLTGIDPYYGVHIVFTSPRAFTDAFSFVKGNDMFGIGFVSGKDDVLKLATAQTRSQYAAAPDMTIPKAQWPEIAQPAQANYLGAIIGAILVLVLIGAAVRLVMVRRRGA
jgi:hypothetical protein